MPETFLDKLANSKIGKLFTNATINAAAGDSPAVMTASGFQRDNNGNWALNPSTRGATELRNNLAVLAPLAITPMIPFSSSTSITPEITQPGSLSPITRAVYNSLGSMALGEGANAISKVTTGKSIGENIKSNLSNVPHYGPLFNAVPNAVYDFANPFYLVTPQSVVNDFTRNSKNIIKAAKSATNSRTLGQGLYKVIHPDRTIRANRILSGDDIVSSEASLPELERLANKVTDIRHTYNYRGNIPWQAYKWPYKNSLLQLNVLVDDLNHIDKLAIDYSTKMEALKSNPILYNIAKKSPQYLDDIYGDFVKGIPNTEEYVRNLIIRANTSIRRMHGKLPWDTFTPELFGTFLSRNSPGIYNAGEYPENYAFINTGNLSVATRGYGPIVGVYTPKKLDLKGDVSTWWSQRKPDGIIINEGMHLAGNVGSHDFLSHNVISSLWDHLSSKGVPFNYGLLYPSAHFVYVGPKESNILNKFNIDVLHYPSEEKLEQLSPSLTLGYKKGGVIKALTGWKVYLNPKNWGLSRDYEKDSNGNMRLFDDTYRAARQAGEKEFLWNGNRYSTDFNLVLRPYERLHLRTQLNGLQYLLAEGVWNYLSLKNVSPKNIAAIMGNIMQESSFIRNARLRGGDRAEGLFQMHGDDLQAYNNWKRKNVGNLGEYPELDYVLYMIESGDHPYSNEYNRVSADPSQQEYVQQVYGNRIRNNTLYLIDDLSQAWNDKSTSLDYMTDLFANTIERAGRPLYENRRKYASDFYEHFNGTR